MPSRPYESVAINGRFVRAVHQPPLQFRFVGVVHDLQRRLDIEPSRAYNIYLELLIESSEVAAPSAWNPQGEWVMGRSKKLMQAAHGVHD